jgi:transposase
MLERHWKNISGAVDPESKTFEELPPVPRGVSDRRASEADREKRLERYGRVRELHERGLGILTISKLLGMSRGAVRKYVRSESFPERPKHPPRPSMLDPFEPYLLRRWQEGCRNALQLHREIKEQGYPGGRGGVLRWARRRREKPAPSTPGRYLSQVAERCSMQSASQPPGNGNLASPRRAVWLFLAHPDSLDAEEKRFLERMTGCSTETTKAYQLAQRFREMARRKDPEDFGRWMEDALQSGLPDFESFAAGLGREWEAVEAALKKPWSNGQVEGHISRLKFLKRQMYGRASFELLRRRVLNAA